MDARSPEGRGERGKKKADPKLKKIQGIPETRGVFGEGACGRPPRACVPVAARPMGAGILLLYEIFQGKVPRRCG